MKELSPNATEGEWKVVHDGPSYGMLQSPDGRIFSIKELGGSGPGSGMWRCLEENDEFLQRIAIALSATSSAEDVRPRHELIFDIVNLRKALYDISQGKGPFSRDPLTHATDTIESMKCIAQEALDGTYKEGNV